jgi:hypothetical protein
MKALSGAAPSSPTGLLLLLGPTPASWPPPPPPKPPLLPRAAQLEALSARGRLLLEPPTDAEPANEAGGKPGLRLLLRPSPATGAPFSGITGGLSSPGPGSSGGDCCARRAWQALSWSAKARFVGCSLRPNDRNQDKPTRSNQHQK